MKQFARWEKVVIFSLLGLATLFVMGFFLVRYVSLNFSVAP